MVSSVLKYLDVECEEVALYFVSTKTICELHDQFFQDPSPTDCISFPLGKPHLGEIFVCPQAAIDYGAPYPETTLYIIHGLLHLIGYDDLNPKDKRVMRKKEKSCMAHLNALGVRLDPVSS